MIYQPDLSTFKKVIDKEKSHVIWTSLVADLDTPVSAMIRLGDNTPYSFLLESVEGGDTKGRYSILGLDPDLINHLVDEKGRNYSFPSNHAANMTGLAMVFSSIYYRYGKLFWTVAGIVMFSRVYIGVHYPSDVMAGCILGCVYGLLLVKGWKFYHIKTTP